MAPNRLLQVASTLMFVWAALMVAISLAIAVPLFLAGTIGGGTAMLALGILGIAYGYCGRRVRRGDRPFHVLALVAAVCWIVLLLFAGVRVAPIGILINAAVAVIMVTQWRYFTSPAPDVDGSVAGPQG